MNNESDPPILQELVGHFSSSDTVADLTDEELYLLIAECALTCSIAEGSTYEKINADDTEILHAVLARLETGWFSKKFSDLRQVHYSSGNESFHFLESSRKISRRYLGKPEFAFWSSSLLPSGASSWFFMEDFEFSGDRPMKIVVPNPSAKIYTIDSWDDFYFLLEEYPYRMGEKIGPDWQGVSRDYSAVRLTTKGLVLIEGVEFHTQSGMAMLDSWSSECTAWLRGDFSLE